MENVRLDFTSDALSRVASLAVKKKTGARGLRAIMENLMLDILYELPSSEKKVDFIEITADFVNHKIPLYELLGTEKEVA
jgi:ATP-dependent Clp protease ATP-binding subunit ClpX